MTHSTICCATALQKSLWQVVESARQLAHICRLEAEKYGFELECHNLGIAGDECHVVHPTQGYSSCRFYNEEPAWIQTAIQNSFNRVSQQTLKQAFDVLVEYEAAFH